MESVNDLRPLELRRMDITDPLFGHYIEKLRTEMIPYQWEVLNDRVETAIQSGCLKNFRIAAGLEKGEHHGAIFQDSDLAKWLEAVAYSLQTHPDAALEQKADECVALVEKAQQSDGYLNTYYTIKEPDKRWTNLMEGHEMYCAGHFIEAAVAYYEATGKRALLDVMCRYADLIDRTFGPEAGKRKGYPGHEELELALVKLWRVTKEKRYLRLARYFVAQRGQRPLYFEKEKAERGGQTHFDEGIMKDVFYAQVFQPPVLQRTAEGHAVRAVYLYSAMADLAAETGDASLLEACRAIFHDIARGKLYLTGGIGSAEYGERFTAAFDLPNDTCYCETCASIGLALFALRMCRIERDATYADVMERALYNTVLSGVSREGNRFFYVNPLEVTPSFCEKSTSLRHVKPTRQQWFDVACCPTNIARTLGSLGQYLFSANENELFVQLYLPCRARLAQGSLRLETRYPADGEITLSLSLRRSLRLRLRIPAHSPLLCLRLNGEAMQPVLEKGFALLECPEGENVIHLSLDVKPRFVWADPRVAADAGKVALTLGPLIYCLEETDNGANLCALTVDPSAPITREDNCPVEPALPTLRARGWRESGADALYAAEPPAKVACELFATPYFCWGNREKGEMRVWVRTGK